MDHFPNVMDEHSYEKLPPALVCSNVIIFFSFLMYFFKSLSRALATVILKTPCEETILYSENPILLGSPLTQALLGIYPFI